MAVIDSDPLRILWKEMMDALVIVDDEGQCCEINPAACQLLGLTASDIMGQSLDIFLPEISTALPGWPQLATATAHAGELYRSHSSGLCQLVYRFIPHLAPHCHLVVMRDQPPRAEPPQSVLNLSTVGCWQVNSETGDAHWNDAHFQLMGLQSQTAASHYQTWRQRVHPEDLAETEAAIMAVRTADTPLDVEYRVIYPDGQERWMLTRGQRLAGDQAHHLAGVMIDITARKRQEERLQHQAAYQSPLLQAFPDLLLHLRPDGTCLRCILPQGLNREKYIPIQHHIAEVLPPPVLADLCQVLTEALRVTGEVKTHEHSFFKNGCLSYEELRIVALNPLELLVIVRDITDRKITEAALQDSQTQVHHLIANVPGALFRYILPVTGPDRVTYMNAACDDLWGVPAEQVKEDASILWAMVHPDDRAAMAESVRISGETLQPWSWQWRMLTASGQIKWLQSVGRPTRYPNGEIVWDSLTIDITERQRLQEQLQIREQEFRTLVENSPDGILRLDRQYRYVYVNPTLERITGIPVAQYLGKTSRELGFPSHLVDIWESTLEKVFTTAQAGFLEYEIVLPNGEPRLFACRKVPEFAADGTVQTVLTVTRDITELKQAERALTQRTRQERLMHIISEKIRQSLDLKQILATAVAEVRQLLQADRVVIYGFHPDWSGDMLAEAVAASWPTVLGTTLRDPCFVDDLVEAYRQGKINQIEDLTQIEVAPCYRALLTSLQIRANLAIPIVSEDRLWGLFGVHYCQDPHHWQPWEVELIQHLSEQLAIAVQQSHLYSQVQAMNEYLETQVRERTSALQQAIEFEAVLKSITDKVRESLDENQILLTVVTELGRELDLISCDTGIYNTDQTASTITHEYTLLGLGVIGATFRLAEASHPDIYPDLLAGRVVQFCDAVGSTLRANQGRFTYLACPIQYDQKVVGDLWLSKPHDQIFYPREIRLVEQVANQCAIGLRQSRLYQASQIQIVELERLNRLKDDFLSTVSHELRTPMSNIKMATVLLERRLQQLAILADPLPEHPEGDPSANLHRYIQILKDEGQREINLINDLLDLTRLDAHAEPFQPSAITLQEWLPLVIAPFQQRTLHQQQTLSLLLDDDVPVFTTDPVYLQHIVHELLTNACKYTPTGESIQIQAQVINNHLEIAIRNSGIEIDPSEHEHIFERFYRIPTIDPWKYGGTGLGLTLAKKRVEYLGGTIQLHSPPGQTLFIVYLPDLSAPRSVLPLDSHEK